ncbi:MAG: cache domain-containing protein, partial [Rhodocyclaceae bacterium]
MKTDNAGAKPALRGLRVGQYGSLFLSIAVLFLALMGYQILASKGAAKGSALTDAGNLALVLESKLETEFDAADRAVSAMVREIDADAMHQDAVGRWELQIARWLQSRVTGVPSVSALRYFDAGGNRLYSSVEGEAAFNIADRPFFQKLRNEPTTATVFSDVAVGRSSGRVAMWAAKAILGADLRFLGVAVAAIDVSVLHKQFGQINLGKDGVVALRRIENGALVVRFPGPVAVDNQPAPELPVRHAIMKQGPNGTIDITSPVDGIQRIYGYRRIGSFPFFVAVAIADNDFLAEWRRNSLQLALAAVAFLAILAGVFARLSIAESRRNS